MPQVLAANEQFELVKADRENAQSDVLAHGRTVARLKQEEMEVADRISDDHVHACCQGSSLGEIFPSIQVNKTGGGVAVHFSCSEHYMKSALALKLGARHLPVCACCCFYTKEDFFGR